MRPRLLSILSIAVALVLLTLSADVRSQTGQVPLPDGPGRDLVMVTCGECHSLNLIRNSWGYSREGWQALFSSMVAMPDIQASAVADYLATNFPEKPSTPQAVIIPGPAQATIREWLLPTLGQRPHDPLATHDGSIWWTGQYANRLGRLDPTTSAAHEYPLQTGNSGPHGLVHDADGNIWYTAMSVNRIGRFDSTTGIVTEYPMPDPRARGPHTPIFDQRGVLFFTLQSGHVGRLDPATGEVTVARTPTANTYPYGIQVNSQGPIHGATSGGSIQRRARFASGARRAVRGPNPMASRPSATSSGTASRASNRTRLCASIPGPRPSRPGRSLQAAVSCETWWRRTTATSCWPAAA